MTQESTQSSSHDLDEFMRQISAEMAAEYQRIQTRATEDPGTAGDQGEENWAELLRDWLPRSYEVVTKGRIISARGVTGPQVDVLVLKGAYPKKLLNKKLYLAAGVAAAFECKITLKAADISKAIENCAKIKSLYLTRTGTPYRELHSPVVYGLLAHSHSWKGEKSTPVKNIEEHLHNADQSFANHPRLQIDALCVADLATWTSVKTTYLGPVMWPGETWATMAPIYGPDGSSMSSYIGCIPTGSKSGFTPIGELVNSLARKIAWEDPAIRDMADYYRVASPSEGRAYKSRLWPISMYSDAIRDRVRAGALSNGKSWDEWSIGFW